MLKIKHKYFHKINCQQQTKCLSLILEISENHVIVVIVGVIVLHMKVRLQYEVINGVGLAKLVNGIYAELAMIVK